ncbi:MAG: endonuclease/exonuclease/phosphatase family protein [Nocardioides sp.]
MGSSTDQEAGGPVDGRKRRRLARGRRAYPAAVAAVVTTLVVVVLGAGRADLFGQASSPSRVSGGGGASPGSANSSTGSESGGTAAGGPRGFSTPGTPSASTTPTEPDPEQSGRERAPRPQRVLAGFTVARLSSEFRIGTLNILGSQHSAGKGGYGPGTYRAGIAASLIRSRGIEVMGLQEVQDDQLAVLDGALAGYAIWPGQGLGNNGQRLQVAWRDDRFDMVDNGSVSYPFDRQRIPLPYVLLRDRTTGAEFWVITTHNSARDLEGERDAATGIEIALINRLAADGIPVFIIGDMNEHTEFFCRVSAATGMTAANGGAAGGGCRLPPAPLRVDWIMGRGVSFAGYVQDGASLAQASDHYFLYADATLRTSG